MGELIGAGIGAVGSIFGGISASKAMKRVKKNIETQKQANDAWYNRRYNEDATQRADAQRILTKTEEAIKGRNRQAAASQAVMGGTVESVAAAKKANAEALADATSRIAVAGDARKDSIESRYKTRDAQLNSELNDIERQKAHNVTQAAQGLVSAGQDIARLWDTKSTTEDYD
ncbi:MAG: hypothetical protein HDS85_00130 [Bacteroidales bacterium]|nr:hypothetical protein [Bacteroidales bacterium]